MTNLSPPLFTDDMGVCAAEAMNPLGCPGLLPAWSLKMLSFHILVILTMRSLLMHRKKLLEFQTDTLVPIAFTP